MADGLDRDVGLRKFDLQTQEFERRDRDINQDQTRDQDPSDFQHRVVGQLGRNWIGLLVELHHHIDKQSKHENRDRGDHPNQDVMQIIDIARHLCHRRLHIHLPHAWLANTGQCRLESGRRCQNETERD